MSKPTASATLPWVDWSPWTVKGDRRVVAAERAWRVPKPKVRCPFASSRPFRLSEPDIARIRVVPDLFEDVAGPMVDAKGRKLYDVGDDIWTPAEKVNRRAFPGFNPDSDVFLVTLADARRRVFDLIDQTPNVDWLVSTAWPERIAGAMPPQGIGDFHDSDKVCTISMEPRPNLWPGARLSTQAEADERIPHLLRLPAARRWLDVAPTEGINLWQSMRRVFAGPGGAVQMNISKGVDWVRIAGDASPAAKSLVEQCRAAGVPCWCDGDGGPRETPEAKS